MKRVTACILSAALLMRAVPQMPVSAGTEPGLLDVSGFTVRDENLVYLGADYLNGASVLFDDQDKAPSSAEEISVRSDLWNATDRSRNWKPNWQSEFGEDSFYIDLCANYVITGVCYLDTNGVQDWLIEDGEPFSWQTRGSFTTDAYNTWRGVTFDNPRATRWLRFSTACGDSGVSELALYGYFSSELTAAQKEKTAAHAPDTVPSGLTAGQKIGFNAFIDDPMTAIMAAGNVREYHNLSWMFDDDGKIRFTQGSWGDMDSYYAAMKARGISIIPCFQGGSSYISGDKPPEVAVPEGADTTDPASYALHAGVLYQVAARYGSNKDVDAGTLHVADGSEPMDGLGLLDAAENSNEPNKTWSGKANYFTPYELAAMCSADYDGHEGTIPNAGVKQADPGFRLAMGGMLNTASLLDYLSEMKLWFDYNRSDGKFAVDIINVHMGPGADPEDPAFPARVKEIRQWIRENAPGAELWLSEFEVPMEDCENEGTDNHDNELYQLRYAQRVARTYLAAIGAGVDRMTKFQLRDEGEGVYYNSGLVTGKGAWSKKLAWFYTACMTYVLKNAYFAADMTEDSAKRYFFIDQQTGSSIYCLWSPTNDGTVLKDYQLIVPEAATVCLTVPGKYAEGEMTMLENRGGTVTLDVTETPVFLTIGNLKPQIVNGRGRYIRPVSACLSADGSGAVCDLTAAPGDAALNRVYRLFDEPDTMPEYIWGDTAELKTPETSASGNAATAYLQLDGEYVLTGFGVYDTYGTGSIAVYDAHTDKLLWSSDLGSYMCRDMTLTDDSAPTDCLKLVKGGGDCGELALYGYPAPKTVPMDVNADGQFSIADAVTLVKYLLAETAVLPDAKAADTDGNGRLDARDLTLLKRALLAGK